MHIPASLHKGISKSVMIITNSSLFLFEDLSSTRANFDGNFQKKLGLAGNYNYKEESRSFNVDVSLYFFISSNFEF